MAPAGDVGLRLWEVLGEFKVERCEFVMERHIDR